MDVERQLAAGRDGARARLADGQYEDPVVYDWPHIKARTLELGGDKDGSDFPGLAKHVCETIPNCTLVLIRGIGHVPHFEAPDTFYRELLNFLMP